MWRRTLLRQDSYAAELALPTLGNRSESRSTPGGSHKPGQTYSPPGAIIEFTSMETRGIRTCLNFFCALLLALFCTASRAQQATPNQEAAAPPANAAPQSSTSTDEVAT